MPRSASASRGPVVDQRGRTLMLRGANVGGSSKVPRTPNGAKPTSVKDSWTTASSLSREDRSRWGRQTSTSRGFGNGE